MIALRSKREIGLLRDANRIVAEVLDTLAEMVRPGMTTGEMNAVADRLIREKGAVPSFLGYRGYPKSSCISIDEVVVHGIPGPRRIENGQIVSIDVGAFHKGYHGDAALTVPCGQIDDERARLMRTADRALAKAIAAARPGNWLEDISRAIQAAAEAEGFSVVRSFVGHGIGTRLHEEPQIPNFVSGARGPKLKPGMVLAIEPMVNAGTHRVNVLEDNWTAVTADGRPSAHFEHSIVVRDGQAEILSATPRRAWGRCANET